MGKQHSTNCPLRLDQQLGHAPFMAHFIWGLIALCLASVAASSNWTRSCQSTDTATEVLAGIDLSGKVYIYTGADGNLASQGTLALARANASLILTCRTAAKCEAVRSSIINQTGTTAPLEISLLDLSSKDSIRQFANRTIAKHAKIEGLINSAATYGTFMTHDHLVGAMEINLLGPALLTDMLLPGLRAGGRVVNVAAAAYGGNHLLPNATAKSLAGLCTSLDPHLNKTGGYYDLSKFLMVHQAIELARREPTVHAVALAPGVAFKLPDVPDWVKHDLMHFPYPEWLLKKLPAALQRYIEVCKTNEAGLNSCPETQAQGAAVIVAAAAWPEVNSVSGVYLDFDTKALPAGSPNVFGPWTQTEPTCMPRQPDQMDPTLRSDWYDEMLELMRAN